MTDSTETQTSEEAAQFITAAWASAPNHVRELAEQLIRSGEVDESTTLADVTAILEKHYAVKQ